MGKAVTEHNPMDVVYKLVAQVGNGDTPMTEARITLRNHVNGLSEIEQKEFRALAVQRGRQLMSIAEAFNMELTVLGAGQ